MEGWTGRVGDGYGLVIRLLLLSSFFLSFFLLFGCFIRFSSAADGDVMVVMVVVVMGLEPSFLVCSLDDAIRMGGCGDQGERCS